MAAADKARFYLEKSVPELQELQRKGLFSQDELNTIVKKRSDFEHIINGPGSKPADYLRYVAFEINMNALKKKRCLRLGVKSTMHNGQRAVFFILDRGTKKFPADQKLWLQYIDYCQKERANKKLGKVFTSALRMSPREWPLWILAAKHYAEVEGDMSTARNYLQRGLRFNTAEKSLYLEYVKLELIYLTKLSARRRILGLDTKAEVTAPTDETDDMLALPTITTRELEAPEDKELSHLSTANLERLAKAPVMQAALPIAIFDAAMQQFNHDSDLVERFLQLSFDFDNIEPVLTFRSKVQAEVGLLSEDCPDRFICSALRFVRSSDARSPDYPLAIGEALKQIKAGEARVSKTTLPVLLGKAVLLFTRCLNAPDLDEDIARVLTSSIRGYARRLTTLERFSSPDKLGRYLQNMNTNGLDLDHLSSILADPDSG